MNGFNSIIHIVYLLRLLYEIDRSDILEDIQDYTLNECDDLNYDTYYYLSELVIENLFEHSISYFNEQKYINTNILSDKVMDDYYRLADEYGKQKGYSDTGNPYFKDATDQISRLFNFSYSVGAHLDKCNHMKPKYLRKIVIITYEEGAYDMIGTAVGVAEMYQFFVNKRVELQKLLDVSSSPPAHDLVEMEAAA